MDQASFDALFIGVFVLIFIAAISATLFLFREIIDYSDNIFDASNKFLGESVLAIQGVKSMNDNNIIRGVDALAYVTNYGYYETNGSTYRFGRKYSENKDLNVRVQLRNVNGSLTTNVNIAGYYKLNVIRVYTNSTVLVDLVQYTEEEAALM